MAVVLPGSFVYLAHMYTSADTVAYALKRIPGAIVPTNKPKGIGALATFEQVRELCGDKLTGTEKVFTVVRHPYEILADMYVTNRTHLHGRLLERTLGREPTFTEFIQNWYELNLYPYMKDHRLFYQNAAVYLRHERLQADLDNLFRKLPDTPPSIPLGVQNDLVERDHYTTFFDEEAYAFVNQAWQSDIARFGYSFIRSNKQLV